MNPKTKNVCVILGGGGHAKVVLDAIDASGIAFCRAVLDRNASLWGKELLGIPIIGGDEQIETLKKEGVTHFVAGVGGVGDNGPRQKIFEKGLSLGLSPLTVVHPSAVCSRWVKIGRGTVVFAGAVINPGVTIGDNCILNTGVIIDHDCIIKDHVHIATGVKLSGTVSVEKSAHIGTGASIRNNISIGEGAVVGAGSVVVRDVLPGTVVKGVPAK